MQPRQNLAANEEFTHAIELYDFTADADPFIPGYMLCHREGNLFGFKQVETDPYVECSVEVPRNLLESLTNKYRAIGLHELATALGGTWGGTVDDLQRLIRLHSEDYKPEEEYEIEAKSIEDFEDLVRDGKLLIQCDIMATF